VVILLMWQHMWTTWTLTVLIVARSSKMPQQWLYRVAMNSDNVLCQTSLEHTNSTKTGKKKLCILKSYITGYLIFLFSVNNSDIDFYAIDQSRGNCTDFFTLYEYTSCFWPSFVLHSRLTICDCLWFIEGLLWPLQVRKHFYLN
jgi:hypothetical protein